MGYNKAYLEHYGRLGMKWYQHKFGEADGRAKYTDKIRKSETKKMEKGYRKYEKQANKKYEKAVRKGDKEKQADAKRTIENLKTQKEVERRDIAKSNFYEFMNEKNSDRMLNAEQFVAQMLGGVVLGVGYNATRVANGLPINSNENRTYGRTGQTKLSTINDENTASWTKKKKKR